MVRRSPESKEKFLSVALRVIREKGYTATSIEDLCDAAGLTKGSFFHHFATKQDLALEAAAHFANMAEGLFAQADYRKLADPRDRVLAYVDFRAAIMRGELPDYTCLLGMMVQETFATHPAIRDACGAHIAAHARTVEADLAEARRRYVPDATWSPEGLALYTQAVIQGAFILAKAKDGPDIAVECLAHLRRYLETQLTPDAKEPRP